MNRVKELYDAASEYLSLPIGVRFTVGVRLHVIGNDVLAYGHHDEMDRSIFMAVVEKEKLPAFNKLVEYFQERGGYGHYH